MLTKTRRLYTGRWAGLTAKTVSKLCGITHYKAKTLLRLRQDLLNRELNLEDIGQLVYEIKSNSYTDLDRYFGSFK